MGNLILCIEVADPVPAINGPPFWCRASVRDYLPVTSDGDVYRDLPVLVSEDGQE